MVRPGSTPAGSATRKNSGIALVEVEQDQWHADEPERQSRRRPAGPAAVWTWTRGEPLATLQSRGRRPRRPARRRLGGILSAGTRPGLKHPGAAGRRAGGGAPRPPAPVSGPGRAAADSSTTIGSAGWRRATRPRAGRAGHLPVVAVDDRQTAVAGPGRGRRPVRLPPSATRRCVAVRRSGRRHCAPPGAAQLRGRPPGAQAQHLARAGRPCPCDESTVSTTRFSVPVDAHAQSMAPNGP